MQVSDWISTHPARAVTAAADAPMDRVAALFLAQPGLRDLYIVDKLGQVTGVIHHYRLAQTLLAEHLPVQSSHQIIERVSGGVAGDLMNREFVSAHPQEELDNILNRMLEYEVENMPVLDDNGRIIGMIDLAEVLIAAHHGQL